ncbi:TPA: hypothetical protein ACP61A_004363 [Escherichia coli]
MPISGKVKINVIPSASKFECSDKVQSLDSRLALRKKKHTESEQPEISGFPYVLLNQNRFTQGRVSLNTPNDVCKSETTKFTANSPDIQELAEFASECTETKQCTGIIDKPLSFLQRNKLLHGRITPVSDAGTESLKTGSVRPESAPANGGSLPLINSSSFAEHTTNTAEVNNDFSSAQTKDNATVNSNTALIRNDTISISRQPVFAGSLKEILQEQENVKSFDKHEIEINHIDIKSQYVQSELSQTTKKNLKKNQTTTIWNPHFGNQVLLNEQNYNLQPLNDSQVSGESSMFEQLNMFQQVVMNTSNPLLQGMVYRFNLRNYKKDKDYVVVTKEDSGEYVFDSSSKDVFNLLSLNAKYLKLSNWTLKYNDEISIFSNQIM